MTWTKTAGDVHCPGQSGKTRGGLRLLWRCAAIFSAGIIVGMIAWTLLIRYTLDFDWLNPSSYRLMWFRDQREASFNGIVWLGMQTRVLSDSEYRTFEEWFRAIRPKLPSYVKEGSLPKTCNPFRWLGAYITRWPAPSATGRNPFPVLLTSPRYGRLRVFPARLKSCDIPVLWEERSFLLSREELQQPSVRCMSSGAVLRISRGLVPVLFLDGSVRAEHLQDVRERVTAIQSGRPFEAWSGAVVCP